MGPTSVAVPKSPDHPDARDWLPLSLISSRYSRANHIETISKPYQYDNIVTPQSPIYHTLNFRGTLANSVCEGRTTIPTSHSTVSTAPSLKTSLAVHVSPHSPAPLSFTIGTPSSDTRKQIRNRHSSPPSCSPSPASFATRKAGTPSEGISSANVVRPVCAVCESWCSPCTLRKPDPLPVIRKRAGSVSCASNRTQTCDTFGQSLRRH